MVAGLDDPVSGNDEDPGGSRSRDRDPQRAQVLSDPPGWPLWTSDVRPGREHDTTCARAAKGQALRLVSIDPMRITAITRAAHVPLHLEHQRPVPAGAPDLAVGRLRHAWVRLPRQSQR